MKTLLDVLDQKKKRFRCKSSTFLLTFVDLFPEKAEQSLLKRKVSVQDKHFQIDS